MFVFRSTFLTGKGETSYLEVDFLTCARACPGGWTCALSFVAQLRDLRAGEHAITWTLAFILCICSFYTPFMESMCECNQF